MFKKLSQALDDASDIQRPKYNTYKSRLQITFFIFPNIINTFLTEFEPVCVIQSRVVEEQGGSIYLCQLFVSIVNWVIKLKKPPLLRLLRFKNTFLEQSLLLCWLYYLELLFACQSFLISFIFKLHASKPMNFFSSRSRPSSKGFSKLLRHHIQFVSP